MNVSMAGKTLVRNIVGSREETDTNWKEELERAKVLWTHDRNPAAPHAVLCGTPQIHTNCVFLPGELAKNKTLFEAACSELVRRLSEAVNRLPKIKGLNLSSLDRVVAVRDLSMGLAMNIRQHITTLTDVKCQCRYGIALGGDDKMYSVYGGECILPVTDIVTDLTADDIERITLSANEEAALLLPFVLAPVNLTAKTEVRSFRIISLVNSAASYWTESMESECPLCRGGSEVISLGDEDGWKRLTSGK